MSTLIPQVFIGFKVRTLGRLFHPLHSRLNLVLWGWALSSWRMKFWPDCHWLKNLTSISLCIKIASNHYLFVQWGRCHPTITLPSPKVLTLSMHHSGLQAPLWVQRLVMCSLFQIGWVESSRPYHPSNLDCKSAEDSLWFLNLEMVLGIFPNVTATRFWGTSIWSCPMAWTIFRSVKHGMRPAHRCCWSGTWLSVTCSNRSSKKTQQREQQQQDEQFGTGREDLARFSWAQPTYTAVQPTNVTQFFQQYKINCQESLVQQRNNQPSTNFVTFVDKFIKWYFMKDKSILASRKLDGRLQLTKTAFGTCMAILLTGNWLIISFITSTDATK